MTDNAKDYFKRPRPFTTDPSLANGKLEKSFSYPSGHAMVSSSFYGFIIYLAWKKIPYKGISLVISTGLLALILLIGISRSYLHVHYPSDVFGVIQSSVMGTLEGQAKVAQRIRYPRLLP